MVEERVKFLHKLYWVITGIGFLWFLLFLSPLTSNYLPGVLFILLGTPVWYYMQYLADRNEIEIPQSKKSVGFLLLFIVVMLLGEADKLIFVFTELLKYLLEGKKIVV